MPTYDYTCRKCGIEFEQFQSMKDDPLTVCPDKACNGKVKRSIGSGAGLIFKGSGFYTTDYRSDSYKSAAKKDKPAPASDAKKSKTSSKPKKKS